VKHIRRSRHVLIGGAVVALLAGSSAVALAADQQPSPNVYQGCLSHAIGGVYNIHLNPGTAPKCFSHDTPISWNQTGPAGPAGATGPSGAKGDTGATGLPGATGPQGAKGDTGATGLAGSQGPAGDTGPTGLPGTTGPQGDPGAAGPQGPQGPAGQGGLTGYLYLGHQFTVDASSTVTETQGCPLPGKIISGGAWLQSDPGSLDINPLLMESAPVNDHLWEVKIENLSGSRGYQYAIQIVCANASS
jgi:hypothetical protein